MFLCMRSTRCVRACIHLYVQSGQGLAIYHLFGFLLMLHDIRLCLVVPMGPGEDQVCKDRVSVDAISVRANICTYVHHLMSFHVHVLCNVPMLQLMEWHFMYPSNHYTQDMLIMEYLSRGDLLNHQMKCR